MMTTRFAKRHRLLVAAASAWLAACGGSSAPGPAAVTDAQRAQAAASTAQGNASCTAIHPFYWEIGDRSAMRAGGTAGGAAPTATTQMLIASASKWMFGAYVVQLRGGMPTANDLAALRMLAGYTNLGYVSCTLTATVGACFNAANLGGNNSDLDAAAVGKFHYNGGHFQWLTAGDLQLAAADNAALRDAVAAQIGPALAFSYDSPQPHAGVRTSGQEYGAFLRRVLDGQLLMREHLGANAVCTNPLVCPQQALYTPIPVSESWQYSLGHWVESDPAVGDGAFSSPGAFGFYPWIDAGRTVYGVLARQVGASAGAGDPVALESVLCGRKIRRAWLTGVAQ